MSAETPLIDIRPDHWEIVQRILQEHVPNLEVWAFGSRAKWNAKAFSDLDLAIITDEPLPIDTSAALNEAFSESDLPWKVDVVDWASVGDGLKKAIKRDKVLVQEKGESTRSEWKQVSLHEVCQKVTSGGTPSRRNPAYYEAGVWPWVKTQELKDGWLDDTEEHITDAAIAESSARVLPANTVLLAMYGATVGQLGILRRPMACNQACCAIISDDKKSDFRFLYYWLLNIRSELRNLATGAAQQNLSGALIKSLQLTLPDIFEQRAIARILGTLDDKIELNRKQNKTLEAMARAMFKAWFVDFEPVRAKMEGRWKRGQSLPGMPAHLYDLFPDRMVESELGEIPEGWRCSTIGEEVTVCGGSTPSTKEAAFWENGQHCWATPKDLAGKRYPVLMDTDRKITDAGLAKISSGLLPVGTVLLSSRAPIGYLAISEVPVAINQGFIAMKCNGVLSSLFVLMWCAENMGAIIGKSNGSTFQEVSKSSFRSLPVVVSPTLILDGFSKFVDSFYRRIVVNERESAFLARVRDILLPKLISGDLRVSNAALLLDDYGVRL
jgi:restriction modification system DNA specificity domain protein